MSVSDKASPEPAPPPATGFVAGWRQTDTLNALRELLDLSGQVRPAVASRTGLTPSEIVALEHLIRGPIGPAEVARLLGVTTAAATGIVDRLAARGHVERRPHETDRRRTELVITDSAREDVLAQLLPMFQALARLDAELSEDERRVVDRFLRRAIEAVRTVL
jgi:DNA-binding MarR family transcriptional regulator